MSYEGGEYSEYEQQAEGEERMSDMPVEKESQDASQEICRDFVHGRDSRSTCKYKHDTAERDNKLAESPVCKDYQGSKCYREKCKYLHLTQEEEEQFKNTGILPEKKSNEQTDFSRVELCRDFKNGFCMRGNGCKYAHKTDLLSKSAVSIAVSDLLYSKHSKPPNSASEYFSLRNNRSLEQENEALKREVLALRMQVLQLQLQNDTILRTYCSNNTSLNNKYRSLDRSSLLPNPYPQNGYHY